MIVDPDFLSHWRTQLLADRLDGDPCAPLYVLRLWAHCQLRRAWRFEMPSAAVKALCRFVGDADVLEDALAASGYLRREGPAVVAIGWDEHNATLVASWANGRLGGRPRKAVANPNENPAVSGGMPTGAPGQSDKRREEKNVEPSALSARPTVPCPYAAITDLYHEKLPDLPRIRLMNDARQRALRKTWGWVLSSTKHDGTRRATSAEEALAWFSDYFALAAANDFLMGRGRRDEAHAKWRCDLEFLLSDRGMRHVIEKTEVAA